MTLWVDCGYAWYLVRLGIAWHLTAMTEIVFVLCAWGFVRLPG